MTKVETLRISAHGIEAEFAPACGGLTVSASQHGQPLLYTPKPTVLKPGMIHYFGNWPLAPFANRAFGAVVHRGKDVLPLPANDPDQPNMTIHGFSWQQPWEVLAHAPNRIHLRHRQSTAAGPYRYTAEQKIAATSHGLETGLSVTNDADQDLPFGLGLHPWLPRDEDTELSLFAGRILALGHEYRPKEIVTLNADSDFSEPRRLHDDRETVVQFCESTGPARIRYPSRGYQLIARWENASYPLLWSPKGAPFLCLEPQTHALGAPSDPIAQDAGPLTLLAPGETLSMRLMLTSERLS